MANQQTFCCLFTNQLTTHQIISKLLRPHTTETSLGLLEPLFLQKFHFFETTKAANTGIKQPNFININMPKYTNRNVSNNTSFHAFLAFGKHIKALPSHKSQSWSHLGGPTQKNHAFTQLLNHR